MLAPRSFSCDVTTASPIHTIQNTPEKTKLFWSPDALMDKNMLRSKQNISGPLNVEPVSYLSMNWEKDMQKKPGHSNIPKIPIPQSFTHPALQHHVRIRPATRQISQPAQPVPESCHFSSLCGSGNSTTPALQHAA